ncbi:NUMOD4 motif [Mycobacteroides abscessus subsp. abscessus]|nr:NUMOD4 motif [Mycobacteroides abscessus subsp. abscessus]
MSDCVQDASGDFYPPISEAWKPIAGYEGWYEVSNRGRVRSLDRTVIGRWGPYLVRGRTLAPPARESGHLSVGLYKNGPSRRHLVHRLVLEAFVGPAPEGMVTCHNNGDPSDNRIENLRWDTQSANQFDSVRHGTHAMVSRATCLNCGASLRMRPNGVRKCFACDESRTRDRDRLIRDACLALGLTQREYRRRYGSSRDTARAIAEATPETAATVYAAIKGEQA